jgi:hypothetical protein
LGLCMPNRWYRPLFLVTLLYVSVSQACDSNHIWQYLE